MKILIIGDIYGKAGKKAIQQYLPYMKKQLVPDVVIANAENTSEGGKSLIEKDYNQLSSAGIDYFTMGNHTFRNKNINNYIDKIDNMVRPANWPDKAKGKGFIIFDYKGKKILLMNLLGQAFIKIGPKIALSPFEIGDEILVNNDYDLAIIDFHGEATAEKIVLGTYFSNRVGIFFGTHTHVQTADERILKGSTAFITDVGMTGVLDSAIGADMDAVLDRMKNNVHAPFVEAIGKVRINAILVTLEENTLKPINIERITLNP